MLNTIDFLERMGQDADLRHPSETELAKALLSAQIDPLTRKAILAADERRLDFLVGAQPTVCWPAWRY